MQRRELCYLSSVAPSVRIRGRRHKLEHRRFCLNFRKHFFILWMMEHWLRRELVELWNPWRCQKLPGYNSGWPCLCRGLAGDLQVSLPTSQPFCDSVPTSQVLSVQIVSISLFSCLPFSIFFSSSSLCVFVYLWFLFGWFSTKLE